MGHSALKQQLMRMLADRRVSREQQAGADPADVDPTVARNRAREAREIQLAIERIDNGTYGECSSCGEPIGEARLGARPFATHCVDCATQAERRRPHREVASVSTPYLY